MRLQNNKHNKHKKKYSQRGGGCSSYVQAPVVSGVDAVKEAERLDKLKEHEQPVTSEDLKKFSFIITIKIIFVCYCAVGIFICFMVFNNFNTNRCFNHRWI